MTLPTPPPVAVPVGAAPAVAIPAPWADAEEDVGEEIPDAPATVQGLDLDALVEDAPVSPAERARSVVGGDREGGTRRLHRFRLSPSPAPILADTEEGAL